VLLRVVALVLAASALGAAFAAAKPAADGTLYVAFGQDTSSITLSLADGSPVATSGTVIPAGTYAVVIDNPYRDDQSVFHMFDLKGPGVLILTDLNAGEEQQAVFPAVFQASSTYTWQDDRNPALHGTFRTTATVTATSGGTTTSATKPGGGSVSNSDIAKHATKPLAFKGTLGATIATNGVVALMTKSGKPVDRSPLPAGRYTLVLSDNDPHAGFVLSGLKSAPVAATSASFLGRRSLTVSLKPGQWTFYASNGGAKHYFVAAATA
jgi:hypothetical protein